MCPSSRWGPRHLRRRVRCPVRAVRPEGGGRRIEVSFDHGYPYSQVYAPADDDVVALEPMTAPTNALVEGGSDLALVPGESYRAEFTIRVSG